jgi:hypothetical protein
LAQKHGIIGNQQIIEVEKEVFVKDDAKMKEYELKLEQEKEEMRRKMIDDKKAIEAQKNLKESEKKELLEQL